MKVSPTPPSERYEFLDILRGFALVGVLFANMPSHSGFFFLSPEEQATLAGPEGERVIWGLHFLTDGKFYSLFSLLFGLGFGLQLHRAQTESYAFKKRFRRRLGILLLFGLLHTILLYLGDILMVYALLGFVLMFYSTVSDQSLIRWILVLLALPILQYSIFWSLAQGAEPASTSSNALFAQLIKVYREGTYGQIIQFNFFGTVFGRYPDLIFTGRFFRVLGMFLLGYFIARKQYFVDLKAHSALFKKVVFWGFLIGIPCNLALAQLMSGSDYYAYGPLGILQPLVYAYGVPALGLAYAASLALLYQRNSFRSVLKIFSPYGRMALSNYLMQSIFALFIYQSVGGQNFALSSPGEFMLTGLGILAFQLVFSYVWLKRFRFGPMEWLWRSLTYGRWPSM